MPHEDAIFVWEQDHKFCYKMLRVKDATANHYTTSGNFIDRSSRPEVFCEKGVTKISQISPENNCDGVSFKRYISIGIICFFLFCAV